jgi:hypothetical protein
MKILSDKELADLRQIEWMKQLNIGDLVCTQDEKNLRITRIDNVYSACVPSLFLNIIYTRPIPISWSGKLHDALDWLFHKIGFTELYDRTLTLEDGGEYSAYLCCNPTRK